VWIAIGCVLLLAAGCESGAGGGSGGRGGATGAGAAAALPRGAIGHVVIVWLKEPGNPDGRRQVIDASDTFRSVAGVLSVEAGEKLASPRRNVDDTYDVAVVMWFKDRPSLERYQTHPAHLEMLSRVGPLIDRTIAYDFMRAIR
jgi:hypothetical protein